MEGSVSCICMACFFFFSSRRRHTRYWRDWSSDVCSSDLLLTHFAAETVVEQLLIGLQHLRMVHARHLHTALLERRGDGFVVGIGLNVEVGAQYFYAEIARMDDKGMVGVF